MNTSPQHLDTRTPQQTSDRLSTASCDDGQRVRPFTSDASLPGLSFARILRSELGKLTGMRSTLWLSITSVVMTGLMVTLILYSFGWMLQEGSDFVDSMGAEQAGQELLTQVLMAGLFFALILIGCIGVLSVTSEYGSGSIRSTMAAVPRRLTLVTAKATAAALTGAAIGAALILGATLAVVLFLSAHDLSLAFGSAEVWQIIGANLLVVVVVTLLGFGLGLILRSSAGSIVVLAALLFIGPMAMSIIAGLVTDNPVVDAINTWQFGALIDSFRDVGSSMTVPEVETLDPAQAGLGLLVWLLVALGLGTWLFRRRDV